MQTVEKHGVVRLRREWLLAGVGGALVVLGAGSSISPSRDIVQEAQGRCDFVPCVTLMTTVRLAIAFVVTMVGAFVMGLAVATIRRSSAG